jgi:hypothetical protein
MTSTECRLRNASAVAGKVWSVAAGVLMHGPLRSHRCGPGDLGTTATQSNARAGLPVKSSIRGINDRTDSHLPTGIWLVMIVDRRP